MNCVQSYGLLTDFLEIEFIYLTLKPFSSPQTSLFDYFNKSSCLSSISIWLKMLKLNERRQKKNLKEDSIKYYWRGCGFIEDIS